jgi:hypothetical protein
MHAMTNCTASIVESLTKLEDATCGDDGLIVGLGVYFETVCGLATAVTLCYLAWTITPVRLKAHTSLHIFLHNLVVFCIFFV